MYDLAAFLLTMIVGLTVTGIVFTVLYVAIGLGADMVMSLLSAFGQRRGR